ncbi:hypothetical protein [Caballeronia arationis]|uniref:hypothetical protein n=1 Tax=Caballeronia arationis TaxID=1777142 RepID=UPI000B1065F1|nr:hypothetical protein [Caballeronia arationis]
MADDERTRMTTAPATRMRSRIIDNHLLNQGRAVNDAAENARRAAANAKRACISNATWPERTASPTHHKTADRPSTP